MSRPPRRVKWPNQQVEGYLAPSRIETAAVGVNRRAVFPNRHSMENRYYHPSGSAAAYRAAEELHESLERSNLHAPLPAHMNPVSLNEEIARRMRALGLEDDEDYSMYAAPAAAAAAPAPPAPAPPPLAPSTIHPGAFKRPRPNGSLNRRSRKARKSGSRRGSRRGRRGSRKSRRS